MVCKNIENLVENAKLAVRIFFTNLWAWISSENLELSSSKPNIQNLIKMAKKGHKLNFRGKGEASVLKSIAILVMKTIFLIFYKILQDFRFILPSVAYY